MQIRRLCESLTDPAPEGAELEAFLAHPNHVLARLSRDISGKDVIVGSFEKPMQVCMASVPSATAFIAAQSAVLQCLTTLQKEEMIWVVPASAYRRGRCS